MVPQHVDPGQLRGGRPVHPGQHQGAVPVPLNRPDPFDRDVLAGSTLDAGRDILGALLVRDDETGRRAGRIVEVEAYIGQEDLASHARFGRTARNQVMFGPPGHAYVYLVYGMHACLNVVTGPDGSAAALLVRAVEPLEGIDRMRASRIERARANRRIVDERRGAADAIRIGRLADHRLASGPGLVAAAFGLDQGWTGTDLCTPTSVLRLEKPGAAGVPDAVIRATPRIGIGYAGDPWVSQPWRFSVAGHPSVSGPAGLR